MLREKMMFDQSQLDIPGFPGPLYAQVAGYLRRKIASSDWSSSSPIPNETTLAKDIGVSVGTIRKALEVLEAERLIHRRQGRGTFIVEASEENDLQRFSRLTQDGTYLRMAVQALTSQTGPADATEARKLGIRVGEAVVRIDIVWRSSNSSRAAERIVVSAARFPGLDDIRHMSSPLLFPLYRNRYQIVVSVVTERVHCTNADADLARTLGLETGQAVLVIDRIASAAGIGPVEWSVRHLHLGAATYSVRMS